MGSVASGLCSSPLRPERWLQVPTIPVECVAVQVVLHLRPEADTWCYALEATDPHTRELLGMIVEPTRRLVTPAQACSLASTDVRATLLALTDPEPF